MNKVKLEPVIKKERLTLPKVVKDNKIAIIDIAYEIGEWVDLEENVLPKEGKNKVLDVIRSAKNKESDLFKDIIKKAYLDNAIKYLFTEKKDLLDNIISSLPEKPAKCKQCGAEATIIELDGETTITCPTMGCIVHEYVKDLPLKEWNDYMGDE